MESSAPSAIPAARYPSLTPRGSSHYSVVGQLGRGGMAVVHEVVDLRTGRRMALKRLDVPEEPEKRAKSRRLFEREFQTLSQLSHPRIVEVFDYAVDETGPFYTMELLSGGDLSQQVPMESLRACRLAKDVCSALSLIHSRSMVHRDVSSRNIRCTADGLTKLIDFGAMAPFGRNRGGIVGTPAYSAPEVVNGQPLDARTDLYALGATLYYALTGRHAYPAKDFASLPERWQCACPNPSEYVPDIPAGLDALVMELLRLDPLARPASAFEVITRLCAIDGLPFDEQVVVAQAYLSTPSLVGRTNALAAVQTRIQRAARGRGCAMLVSGPSGVGRSRFLDAVALEARLRGGVVLAVDAEDGRDGDYGVVRGLVRRLIGEAKERVVEATKDETGMLGAAVPELAALAGSSTALRSLLRAAPDVVGVSRPEVQGALRKLFTRLAAESPMVIVVDDLHAVDEPSAAFLALLAHAARQERLLIVASAETSATPTAPAAMRFFSDASEHLDLSPLTADETEHLLRSIFGNVPNVGLLSHRIHGVAAGNPRNTMELAQHLVEQHVVHYEGGAWSVPGAFEAHGLPATMAQALAIRVAALSGGAREMAAALALSAGLTVSLDELRLLAGPSVNGKVAACVDELLRAHVVRLSGDRVGLAHESWSSSLQHGLSPEDLADLHRRLATLFERRKTEEFRRGRHLLRAGQTDQGLEVLAKHAELSTEETGKSPEAFLRYVLSLPRDWFEIYDQAIGLCVRTGRRKKDAYLLRSRLCGILGATGQPDVIHTPALIRELAEYTGLSDLIAMDPMIDPRERIQRSMKAAAKRYAESTEGERVVDPRLALRNLGRAVIQVGGVITSGLDGAFLRALPSLMPLAPISPSFAVVQMLIDGMGSRFAGRLEEARATYLSLVERLLAPDGGGLDGSHHEYMRIGVLNGVALIEAGMGLDSTLDRANELEPVVRSRVNAVQVRMLYHLWQGNIDEALRLTEQVELLQIQDSPRQLFEGTHLLWQVTAHGLSDDLTHLKQTIDEIAPFAARHLGWKPVHHYATGEFHRVGGAHENALAELRRGLLLIQPGEHLIWPFLAGAELRTLFELGRLTEAVELGEKYVEAAREARLGYLTSYVLLPLAVAHAKLGHKEAAIQATDRVLSQFQALGVTGLNLGVAYETRSRVALLLGDRTEYGQYMSLCRNVYTTRNNPALVTKFEKLRRGATPAKQVGTHSGAMGFFSTAATTVGISRLDLCQGPEARANCALSMVIDQCGASAGVLYLVGAHGPFAAASLGNAPAAQLGTLALEYLASEAQEVSTTGDGGSMTTGDSKEEWVGAEGKAFRPVLLTHESSDGFLITGVAVVVMPPEMPFSHPARIANEVSQHLRRMGDATGFVVAG